MAQIKGTLTNVGDTTAIAMPDETQAIGTLQITASADASTIVVEGSLDGATFAALQLTPVGGGAGVASVSGVGMWNFNYNGLKSVRARKSAAGIGGAQTVYLGVVYI